MNRKSEGSPVKAALRADARARRDALTPEGRAAASLAIAARAVTILEELRPSVIAAYCAIRTEVDTDPIVRWALGRDMVVVLPAVIDPVTLAFRRFRRGDPLIVGEFGTIAPGPGAPEIDPDLVIAPLIAFDRQGSRVGHGRGFYDRAIWNLRARGVHPALLGIAFAAQEVAAIPAESHDIRMDWVVTEQETLDFRRFG